MKTKKCGVNAVLDVKKIHENAIHYAIKNIIQLEKQNNGRLPHKTWDIVRGELLQLGINVNKNYLNYRKLKYQKKKILHNNNNNNKNKKLKSQQETITRPIKKNDNNNNTKMDNNNINILKDHNSITGIIIPQHNRPDDDDDDSTNSSISIEDINKEKRIMISKLDLNKDDKKLYKTCVNEIVNEYEIALIERRKNEQHNYKRLNRHVLDDIIYTKWYNYGLIQKNIIPVPAKTIRNRLCLRNNNNNNKDNTYCIHNSGNNEAPIEGINEGEAVNK